MELVNGEDFGKRIHFAALRPDLLESKKLYDKMMPLIRLTGSGIKWSEHERQNAASHLYAMTENLGAPFLFVTFSPKVIENALCLEFAVYGNDKKKVFDLKLNGNIAERGLLLSRDPVAAARAFQLIIDAFCDIFLGMPNARNRRKSFVGKAGIFGPVSGFYGIHEVQGRGILHMHSIIFGLLMPSVISKLAHNPELKQQFCDLIDTIVSSSLGGHDEIRKKAEDARKLKKEVFAAHRAQLLKKAGRLPSTAPQPPLVADLLPANHDAEMPLGYLEPVNPELVEYNFKVGFEFTEDEGGDVWKIIKFADDKATCKNQTDPEARLLEVDVKQLELYAQLAAINACGMEIAAHFCYHVHTFTCHKSTGKIKRFVCRLARPARLSEQTKLVQVVALEVIGDKVIVGEQQPDGHIELPRESNLGDLLDPPDDRALALVLERDDGLQVETSLPLASAIRSNSNVSPLGCLSESMNALHYLVHYFSKKA